MRLIMKRVIILLILSTVAGCTATVPGKVVVKTSTSPSVSIKPVEPQKSSTPEIKETVPPEKDGSAITQQIGDAQNVPSPSPSPTAVVSPRPTVSPELKPPCTAGPGLPCKPEPSPKYNPPPYSTSKPVSPNMRSGYVNITFKDEFKVRYNKEQKLFISQIGQDTTIINNLMKEYQIKQVGDFLGSITQEQADEQERISEANSDYDQPNRGSQYILLVENINVKEFVDRLRTSSLVREANIPDEVVPH